MSLPAEFHDIAKRVNNWGRWGADDEIGTLNLITDEVVRDAAATVRSGPRIPLALPLQQDGVQTGMIPGRVNPLHAMVQINQEIFGPGTVATSDDAVTHGPAGGHPLGRAHPCLALREDLQRPPRRHHHRARRRRSSAASTKAPHLVSRGVLLDVARARGVDRLPGDHAVTPEDLDAAEELGGHRVRAGDIVLVRTGQIQVYLAGDKHAYAYPSPGLSMRTPEWFHARDVAAVANDTLTFEIFPPEIEDLWLPVHALDLVEMGMLQGQNWNLEGAVHGLCGGEAVRLPAVRDAGTVRRRPPAPRSLRWPSWPLDSATRGP